MSGAHEVTWWGGFDPYTFGVWASQDKIFDLPDPHDFNFLFLGTLVAPPEERHQAYIKKLKSEEERILAYTAFTLYVHEWRHWYDMTSTPFGLVRIGQLAAFFATVAGAYDALGDYKRIYAPLIRWVRSPNLVQAAYPGIGELSPAICAHLEKAFAVLRKADAALRGTSSIAGKEINTSQILESLAMLRQEQAIEDSFGADAARLVRQSIKSSAGGERYYTPISFLESKGVLSRDTQIRILETTLFANYGVYGSQFSLTPSMIFAELLAKGIFDNSRSIDEELDRVLFSLQGFNRETAFGTTYEVTTKTMRQIYLGGAAEPDQDSHVARMLSTIGTALPAAFLMGAAARYEIGGIKEAAAAKGLNAADPYFFYAPLIVEGNPGQITPDSVKLSIDTLAGATIDSAENVRYVIDRLGFSSSNPMREEDEDDGPYTMSVVWTPHIENKADVAPYYKIFDIFQDLMYWRGLLFGRNSIAPATYFFTTERTAEERGQELVY